MRLRITLDFDVAGVTELGMAHLRGFLSALERHQDFGLRISPRDLRDAGFEGVGLVAAEAEETGTGRE